MYHNFISEQNQTVIDEKLSIFANFFSEFKIGSLLNKSGISKTDEILIFDDSTYDRSRSKKMELLSRVFDHNTNKYLKGFRMLALEWSDGNSFLGLDFALLSSAKESNRYNGITKDLDKRTCGYQRCKEAMTKSTELMEPMLKRALAMGVRADMVDSCQEKKPHRPFCELPQKVSCFGFQFIVRGRATCNDG